MPILSAIAWTPIVGLVVLLLLPNRALTAIRATAIGTAAISFVLSWSLLFRFDRTTADLQFEERYPWIPELGMTYAIGVDGLSLPLLLLCSLVTLVAFIASIGIVERVKAYFAFFLLLEFAMLGVFLSQDWFLFYVFWEISLVPMFFLIGLWGGARRDLATMSFFLYTLGGSVFMLLGIIAVYLNADPHTFDMRELAERSRGWTVAFQIGPFLAFFVGFAVKIPVFPLHGWLPLAHVEAPTPVSIVLSGVLLKMGGYGLLRVAGLLPGALDWFAPFLLALGLVNILYGALLAWRQTDLKAMVAFSSIDHMGFVLVGVAALNAVGFTGALMMMVTHGIITGALFLLVGALYDRTHTRELGDFGGLLSRMPMFSILLTLAMLASMGLPGLAQFVSEFHVLVGGFQTWGLWVVVAIIGILVTAAYSLRVIGRALMGPLDPRWAGLSDLGPRELVAALPLAALTIGIGLFPSAALGLTTASIAKLGALFVAR